MPSGAKIRVGLAGIGFMGVTHFNAYKAIRGAKVEAIAEEDPIKRTGDWSGVRGNFGSGGGQVDVSKLRVYADYADMARDPDLDLIDICLPTPAHAKAAITCLQAGKHVLLEKPIALSLADADSMLQAAKKAKRHLFVGHVLRYFPQYRYLKQACSSGRLGKLLAARFRRIIARPNWPTGGLNWFNDPKKSGGAVIDLHIHDADYVLHLLGKPKAVDSRGVPARAGTFDYITTQYDFGRNGPAVTSEGGWIAAQGLPFEQSFEAYFEKGTILYNSSDRPLTLLDHKGGKVEPKLSTEDGFVAEIKAVIQPLAEGGQPGNLLGAAGQASLALCLAEQESARTGKRVVLR